MDQVVLQVKKGGFVVPKEFTNEEVESFYKAISKLIGSKGIKGQFFGFNYILVGLLRSQLESPCSKLHDNAQRELIPSKVVEIQDYIYTSVIKNTPAIFSPLVFVLNHNSPANMNQLLIVDGQHRMKAITAPVDEYNGELKLNEDEKKKIDEELNSYTYPAMIIICDPDKGIGLMEAQQIFSDLNFFATKVPRSLALQFNSRDEVPILVNEITNENKKIANVVYTENKTRENKIIKLSILHDSINQLFYGKATKTKRAEKAVLKNTSETHEDVAKKLIMYIVDEVITDNKKDFINKSSTIQAIAKYTHTLIKQEEDWLETLKKTMEKALDEMNSDISILQRFGFTVDEDGHVTNSGTGSAIKNFENFLNNCKP